MDKEITLTLSVKEVELLLEKLSEFPIKDCLDIFMKVRFQAAEQMNPTPERTPAPEKPNVK